MKIGICEDEATFLEYEYNKIKEFFLARGQQVQIHTYPDGTQLLQDYDTKAPFDLLVLDLQMTHSDGMDIARKIRESDSTVPIIFVTGVESRAIEGYHVEALDYIIKTQLDSRLEEALSRFLGKYSNATMAVETAEGYEEGKPGIMVIDDFKAAVEAAAAAAKQVSGVVSQHIIANTEASTEKLLKLNAFDKN